MSHGLESVQLIFGNNWLFGLIDFKQGGFLGVQLFFGLSGFLITSRLLEEESLHGRVSLRLFYLRRAFRILPATLFFLAVVGVLAFVGILNISLGRWLSVLLFAANYSWADASWYLGHFWSLAVEEHFYFIWPLLFIRLAVNRPRILVALGLALLIAFWRALDFKYHLSGTTPAMSWGRTDIAVDGILWGVFLALVYGDVEAKPRIQKFLKLRFSTPLIAAALLMILIMPSLNWKFNLALVSIKAMLIPLLILSTQIQNQSSIGRLLESVFFRKLGRLSFSLYLWQQLFLVWNAERVPGLALLQVFPVNIIAALACANLSLVFIEKPMIAVGHRIAKRR